MLIPIRTDNRLKITPTVNHVIIVANLAVFLLQFIIPNSYETLMDAYKLNPAAPKLYQFFTYMFLHASWMHIIGNMLFLWVFGNAINDRFGHVSYTAFYLGGGVLSGIGYVLLSGHAPVVGASGAISAVTGCFLVLFPRVRVTVLLILVWIMPMEISSLIFLGFQLVFNLWASATGAGGGVAYAAHASGYIYGILIAGGLLWIGVLPRDVYDMLSLWKTHRRRQTYRKMVSQGFDPFGAQPPKTILKDAVKPQTATPQAVTTDSRQLELKKLITERHREGNLGSATELYLKLLEINADATLPLQQQLDISNKLMSDQQYQSACESYLRLLKYYPGYSEAADIRLMLGILYGRYLKDTKKARENLTTAIETLKDATKIQMAKVELSSLGS